jgi:hypothetical protein
MVTSEIQKRTEVTEDGAWLEGHARGAKLGSEGDADGGVWAEEVSEAAGGDAPLLEAGDRGGGVARRIRADAGRPSAER